MNSRRRSFLKRASALAAVAAGAASGVRGQEPTVRERRDLAGDAAVLAVNPTPLFEISPHLYMQFMEPLGVTDSSMEAAWSYDGDDWRRDFVEATKDLAPGMMRYGGLISRYYKWREGVGPADKRPWFRNYLWGGKETHRVGSREFSDFCKRVAAEPMYCVNFLSDGRAYYSKMKEGNRTGDATEAADWVSYANDPDHAERKSHGSAEPFNFKYWQLGNETNYGPGGFTKDQSIEQTIAFSKAMRARDPSIKLLGWGDVTGGRNAGAWAGDLAARAGEHVDLVAFHMMQQSPIRKDTVLHGMRWQERPREAWDELMEMVGKVEGKLRVMEQSLDAKGSKHPLAITEGHLSLEPRNTNPLLTEWLTGVYNARVMNLYERHGDRLKIATLADYCGNRWTTNAMMIQTPGNLSYLLPAGVVARLYRKHGGTHGVVVKKSPAELDVAASRKGDTVYLHVANSDYASAVPARFAVEGMAVTGARVHAIAPEDPRQAVNERTPNALAAKEHAVAPGEGGVVEWRFPARSVSAVELTCRAG